MNTARSRFGIAARARWVALALAAAWCAAAAPAGAIGFGTISRDTFPVFDDPPMLSAAAAEARGLVRPRDGVIGVAYGGEARAYPVIIMGHIELGNDTIAGTPIAVTW